MTSENILKSITPVFREVFEAPSLVLTENLGPSDIEKWDSLNHISLIVEIESLTGLSMTADELANLKTVGDIVRLLKNKGYEVA